jgi:hypothetical protein
LKEKNEICLSKKLRFLHPYCFIIKIAYYKFKNIAHRGDFLYEI